MKHFTKLVLGALLACAITVVPLRADAAQLSWSPQWVDFGMVPIGSTAYQTFTLTNEDAVDPIAVSGIEFTFNQGGAFTWSAAVPTEIPPGGSLDVELSFTPNDWSFAMADMWVYNNSDNASPGLYMQLLGEGSFGDPCPGLTNCGGLCVDTQNDVNNCGGCWMACTAPENGAATCEAGGCGFVCDEGYEAVGDECVLIVVESDPLAMIGDIIDFFEASRADGTLVGLGPGASGEHRADAMGAMLEEAEALIAAEDWDEACGQVRAVYARTDNSFPPPDFVAGENTYALAEMLWDLGVEMDCSIPPAACSAAPGTPAAPSILLLGVVGLALARLRRR